MLSGKNIKAVVVLLFVIAVAVTNGVPTTSNDDTKIHLCGLPPASNAYSPSVLAPPYRVTGLEQNQIIESSSSHLATIAEELLKPPACFINSPVIHTHTSSLPPVPKALFMALVGFLCVSLVKDRKVWMAVFVALIWLGQAGVTTLPRLALHLAGKRQIKQTSPNVTCAHKPEESERLRSDIEGTQYIGLLHYLAGIPYSTISLSSSPLSLRAQQSNLKKQRTTQYDIRNTNKSPKHAIVSLLPNLTLPISCMAYKAKQLICFSPAFIFSRLARSPPEFAYETTIT